MAKSEPRVELIPEYRSLEFWDSYEGRKACLCGRTFRTRFGRWFHRRFQGPLR